MTIKRKPGRPRKTIKSAEVKRLEGLLQRQDNAVDQALDTVTELNQQVEFYRKQVNHLLALLNILAKGA